MQTDPSDLEKECLVFTRYLTGAAPSAEVVERYSRASEFLFSETLSGEELSVLKFAVRNPWSLGFLDAGSAFFMKNNILRGKILALVSILEAHPGYTRFFIPGSASRAGFLLKGCVLGASSILKSLVGFFLLPVAKRSG